ncbi:MAG: Nif11 family protein [Acidobacteriota bacterium]
MSQDSARQFFEKLNTTESMQQAVLDTAQPNLQAMATEAGLDCTAEELREVAATELAGRPLAWFGRRVTWRPDIEDGMLVLQPVAEGDDVRLTASELDLVSAGSPESCTMPDCPVGCAEGK